MDSNSISVKHAMNALNQTLEAKVKALEEQNQQISRDLDDVNGQYNKMIRQNQELTKHFDALNVLYLDALKKIVAIKKAIC